MPVPEDENDFRASSLPVYTVKKLFDTILLYPFAWYGSETVPPKCTQYSILPPSLWGREKGGFFYFLFLTLFNLPVTPM